MRHVLLLITLLNPALSLRPQNNVCKTYRAYLTRLINPTCSHSDDYFATAEKLLENLQLTSSREEVITDDGYVLSMLRIPSPGNETKGVLVFIPPLTFQNNVWLLGGQRSAAHYFLLEKYEIWLPNWRGLPNSRGHVNPSITTKKYFDFGLTEIGKYDIAAIVRYISQFTGKKCIIYGHAVGASASLIYASLAPGEASQYLDAIISTNAITFPRHSSTNLRLLTPFTPLIKTFHQATGISYLGDIPATRLLKKIFLALPTTPLLIGYGIAFFFGGSPYVADPRDVPVLFSQTGTPVSIKLLEQISQFIVNNRDEFCDYDYGKEKNQEMYGSAQPPSYPLENITVPIYLVQGKADSLQSKKPQILEKLNLPHENHTITTEDGYILTIFRVIKDNAKGVIVIGPPIVTDSTTWLLGNNRSYVETFYNNGYEVWLINWRGLPFSDKHVKKLSQLEYWEFSFHEMGLYDCSAILKQIKNVTGSKVIFLTMSMASSAATIYAAEKPEESKELVDIFIAMAVPAFMQKSYTLARLFIPLKYIAMPLQRIFQFGGLFYKTKPITDIFVRILLFFNLFWIEPFIFPLLTGGKPSAFDPMTLPFANSVNPKPASFQTLYHYSQLLTNGNKFVAYDYGKKKNRIKYNSDEPPVYHVGNISVPFHIIYGGDDILANPQGNELLYDKLPETAKIYGKLKLADTGHADFITGRTQPYIIQDHILDLLSRLK